jgi:hypothetical protein
MAVNLSDLLALPEEDRLKLAEALWESLEVAESGPLVKEFIESVERTNRALDATLERLDHFDETLERNRTEVRAAVRRSAEEWPFTLPH